MGLFSKFRNSSLAAADSIPAVKEGFHTTVSFSNQKGGVGKTTSALNAAAFLAKTGRKVLLVDDDPQGNATSGLGISKKNISCSLYDVMTNEAKASEAVQKTAVDNLFALPSGIDLVGAELELVNEERREFRIKDALDEIKNEYNYIIIDSPPSLGLLSVNALCASDSVVIPMLCEYYSLEGLSQLMNSISLIKKMYNPGLDVLGILINMYDGRLNLTSQVLDEIKNHFSDKLFDTFIPRNIKLSEAPSFGMPVYKYDRYSKGALAYESFVKEMIERAEK